LAIYGATASLAPPPPKKFYASPPLAKADPARIAAYAPYFQGEGLKVGLMLGPYGESPALAELAPLLGVPGLRFYALNAETAAQISSGSFAGWIADLSMALTGAGADSADFDAVLSQLDLVIGGMNLPARQAAGFGVSAWAVLPVDAAEFPVASAVSFRQQRPGDWSETVEQLAIALQIATTPEPAHA